MMTVMKIVGLTAIAGVAVGSMVLYAAFGAFLPWNERAEADRLAQLIGIRDGQTIAEIGAGSGRFAAVMAAKVGPAGRVYATELSGRSRDAIRARASGAGLQNVTVLAGAAGATNLPPACCDVVFLRNVYHHVREPDAFARSLGASVRPGGRLAVLDFEPGDLWFHGGRPGDTSERRPGHGVSRADVIAELTAAGLVLEQEIPRWSGPMWLLLFRTGDSSRH